MRHAALLLLWSLTASAQTKSAEFSSIEGRILNAATGEPVAKVSLFLMRIDSTPGSSDWLGSYAATSDSAGKFTIPNIDPGKYRLRASRNGFITLEYGARISQRSGTLLDLGRAQELKDVDVRLTPHGVIAGRVLDVDGEPSPFAQVQLLRSQYVKGKKVVSTMSTIHANDLGEYRLPGLAPGKYYIYAANSEGLPPTTLAAEEYVGVYYPGVTEIVGAIPFDVAAGAQLQAADLMLHKARTVIAKGRVVVELADASGIPSVRFFPRGGHEQSAVPTSRVFQGRVNSAGVFEVRGLTPGSYTAQAEVSKGRLAYGGQVPVEVAGTNIEGVVITIGNGVSMSGRVRVDDEKKRDLQGLKITLQPGGPTTAPDFSGYWTDRIASDLTFKIDNLDPNVYGILLGGLPDGFYIKSVRSGQSEVTYSGVDLTSGASGQVEILVSPKAGVVSGVAQNSDTSQPAPGATAVLVPKEKERAGNFAFYQQATTDQHGGFTFKNVAPGDYKVYAWEDVESSAWMDPEFMKPLEAKGESVTVGESAQASVQVNLISADSEKEKGE